MIPSVTGKRWIMIADIFLGGCALVCIFNQESWPVICCCSKVWNLSVVLLKNTEQISQKAEFICVLAFCFWIFDIIMMWDQAYQIDGVSYIIFQNILCSLWCLCKLQFYAYVVKNYNFWIKQKMWCTCYFDVKSLFHSPHDAIQFQIFN